MDVRPVVSVRRGATRAGGIVRAGAAGAAMRGFSLIEVLLAMVLLAAGLALAFATLTAATRTTQRAEAMAQRSERERAVHGFMRRRIAGTRPVAFATDGNNTLPQRFIGEPDRMRFVADLPDYLGRGGPYLHDFSIEDGTTGVRIELTLSMVQAGSVIEEDTPRPPELLIDRLRSAAFRYRALDEDGGVGEWQDRWPTVERLPLLVEVTLTDADGRQWPPLVVALPQAGAGAGGAFGATL